MSEDEKNDIQKKQDELIEAVSKLKEELQTLGNSELIRLFREVMCKNSEFFQVLVSAFEARKAIAKARGQKHDST